MVNESSTAHIDLRALPGARVKTIAVGLAHENIVIEDNTVSLALSSISSYSLPTVPTVPSVERRPSTPDVAAVDAQRAQNSSRADAEAGSDPYAQIDALLASLRDLTLGGAKLDSASTTSRANAAYAAYSN